MDADRFQALREDVRGFIREVVPRHQAELFTTDRLPEPLRARMAELQLFAMDVPERFGGLGLSTVETCTIVEDICHGPQSLIRWAGPSNSWFANPDADEHRAALIDKYLEPVLQGRCRIAFTLTEPGAGSDAAAITTRAERRGDVYVLNGRKHLISFAGAAQAYLTFAKTDPDAGAYGVTALMVDADLPGLTPSAAHPKLGLDGMPVGEVVFEDCTVPVSQRLGEEGAGFMVAMSGLDMGRLTLIAAVAVGAAQAVVDYCTETLLANAVHGDADWARTALAEMATQVEAARALVRQCAALRDAGERITTQSAMCKLFCAEMNDRVADLGVQIVGPDALDPAHPINRLYRDARLGRIWDGTSEIQRHIIARDVLREGRKN